MNRLTVGRRALIERFGVAFLIAAILTATAASLPVRTGLQGWLSDASAGMRAALFGVRPLASEHVLVVGLDSRSLDSEEMINTPQVLFTPIYEKVVSKALQNGAKGVIFDIIIAYDAKDFRLNDELPLRRYDDPFLRLLRKERDRGRVVLGRSGSLLPARRFALVAGPLGTAMVQVPFGAGGVVRQVPTVLPDRDGNLHPTLSGRGLALLGLPREDPVHILPPGPISSIPSISMIDLLRCEDEALLQNLLDGRVLYFGGLLPGQDRLKAPDQMIDRSGTAVPEPAPNEEFAPCSFQPPYIRAIGDSTVPGVFLHAAAVDAVAAGWELEPTPAWLALVVTLVTGVLAAFVALVLRPLWGILAMIGVMLTVLVLSALFFQYGRFVPLSWAMVAAPVAFIAAYGVRIRLLDRRSVRVRREFGRYLSPVLVRQMIDEGALPDLAGEERDVTVMFADLNGFTAASEQVPSVELMRVLNRYLDSIASVISDHGGYVDKFIGDAAMAIFNAPVPRAEHSIAAVQAAHVIRRRVAEMAADDARAGSLSFGIKIGIASGRATVGNVGARDRLNYTVVGETVNLAARLEAMPTLLGTPIVIGPVTAEEVKEHFEILRIARLTVKGKSEGVDVYAPFDKVAGEEKARLDDARERYGEALTAFESGDFTCAVETWRALAEIDWPGASVSGAMAAEAARRAERPPLNWQGLLDPSVR